MELNTNVPEEIRAELDRLIEENNALKKEQFQIFEKVKLLIAKVSHEFKTPLNSIIGFSELIKLNTTESKTKEYADIILSGSEHMLELVQNIIDVTRSQYKPLELSYSIFNTKDIIEEIIKSFGTLKIKYTLINTTICADYMRFKQLVYNLVSNAEKFNKNNTPVDIITYIENKFFCFEITDYGEGISDENFDKIFEIFTRISIDTEKRSIGSGIGLSLCKSIVESHGGTITVSSSLGEGSTFCFKLPIGLGEHSVQSN